MIGLYLIVSEKQQNCVIHFFKLIIPQKIFSPKLSIICNFSSDVDPQNLMNADPDQDPVRIQGKKITKLISTIFLKSRKKIKPVPKL